MIQESKSLRMKRQMSPKWVLLNLIRIAYKEKGGYKGVPYLQPIIGQKYWGCGGTGPVRWFNW